MARQCPRCMSVFDSSHWAAWRQKCPTCGAPLIDLPDQPDRSPRVERYDSSADVQFDLEGLLSVDQRREARLIGWLGFGLLLLTVGLRLGFVWLNGQDGLREVPLWFDGIVLLMLSLASAMMVYAVRKLMHHHRAMRRAG